MGLRYIARFIRERQAQDLIEYTLLLAFVALAIVGVLSQTGTSISGLWTSANSTIALGASGGASGGSGGGSGSGGGDGHGGGDGDGH